MTELARLHCDNEFALTMLGPKEHHPLQWRSNFGGSIEPVGPDVVRLRLQTSTMRLEHVTAKLGHGLIVGIGHANIAAPFETSARSTGLLLGTVVTVGHSLLRWPGAQRISAGQCMLRLGSPGEISVVSIPGEQQLGGLRFVVDPEQFARDFGIDGGADTLRRAIGGFACFDLDGATRRLVDQACALDLERPGATMRLEGLVLQLLCWIVDRLLTEATPALEPPVREGDVRSIDSRAARQAHAARQLVQLHFDRPPTLADLARRIGTNTNKLTQDFKALYGETIARYALRLRMESAKRLLVDEELPVSEVAYRVGYEHHSSFTVAFAGYWGASPSAMVARQATLHRSGVVLDASGPREPRGH